MSDQYVFLSYSHFDIDVISSLVEKISGKVRIIYDTNIGAAREYNNEIAEMIGNARIVIAFISQHYMESSYCIDEILYARGMEIPILLTYLEPTELAPGMKLRLGRFQWLNFYEEGLLDKLMSIAEVQDCLYSDDTEKTSEQRTDEKKEKRAQRDDLKKYRTLADTEGVGSAGTVQWRDQAPGNFSAVAGVYFDEAAGEIHDLEVAFEKKGHYMIAGVPMSGKSHFLQTAIYSLICRYSPAKLWLYIIDYGNYMLQCFAHAPQTGALINDTGSDRLKYLMRLLDGLIKERMKVIRSGTFTQYNLVHGGKLPAIVIAIDDFNSFFQQEGDIYGQVLERIALRGVRYGMYLLLSSDSTSVTGGYDILRNVRNRFFLEQYEIVDIPFELGMRREDISRIHPDWHEWGRGIFSRGDAVCEFQLVRALAAENIYVQEQLIEKTCSDMRRSWQGETAPEPDDVPEDLRIDTFMKRKKVREMLGDPAKLPFGMFTENAAEAFLPLDKIFLYMIVGRAGSGMYAALRAMAEAAVAKKADVYIADRHGRESYLSSRYSIHYLTTADMVAHALQEQLIPLVRERYEARLAADLAGEAYSKAAGDLLQPVFFFIDDLQDFLGMMEEELSCSEEIAALLQAIMEKGRGLHIYFIAATTEMRAAEFSDSTLFRYFKHENNGLIMGMPPTEQNLLSFDFMSFRAQSQEPGPQLAFINRPEDKSAFTVRIPYTS